jgi:hypothetical protein
MGTAQSGQTVLGSDDNGGVRRVRALSPRGLPLNQKLASEQHRRIIAVFNHGSGQCGHMQMCAAIVECAVPSALNRAGGLVPFGQREP